MATRTISTKLAIEGEAQYKQGIASCNAELKTLKSNLDLVTSEFRSNANSMEALTAKGTALQAVYDKQLEKVAKLEAALLNAKQAQEGYAARVSATQENIQRYEQELEKLRQSTGDTSKEQEDLTRELDKWNAELAEAQAGQTAAERGVLSWQKQLNSAKIELNGLSDEIAQNDRYLSEAEQSADGCARSIDQYGETVKEAGESSEEFAGGTQRSAQGIEQLASVLAAAGVAKTVKEITEELLECSDAAAGFETSMAKLSTLVDTSVYPLETIKAQLVELSNETGVAVGALTEAAYQARSAGVDTANVVDFVATATKTSAAGFTDSATAVDVLTTALNAYHMESSQAEKVASMLVKTQDEGKTSVGELAQNMGRVIPVVAAYNVSLGNLTTAYAQLTKSGTNTAIATTNLTAMLNELAKDGSAVAGVLQEQTGQSFAQLMDSGKNLGEIMVILSDSVDGDATAFANLWSSTTAGQSALSLLNSGAEEFTRTLEIMEDSSGAVDRNFQTMANTTEFSQQRMTTAAENLRVAIGDQLNPALETLYSSGADVLTWATEFVNDNPWIVEAVVGITVAFTALTAGVTLYTHRTELASAATAIMNAVMNANPAIFVASALLGVAAGLGVYISSLDDAVEGTEQLNDALEETKETYWDMMDAMEEDHAATEAMADALHELLAVEEKSALQKDLIQQKVDELNEAVPELGLAYDREKDALVGLTEAELDAALSKAAAQETYQAQVEHLSELNEERLELEARLVEAQERLASVEGMGAEAASQYQHKVESLTFSLQCNAAQIAETEAAAQAYNEQQTGAISTLEGLIAQLDELETAYQESHDAAWTSIESQLGLFNELSGEAETSISKLIDTLDGQVEYMETYAANIQKALEMGVDEGLVRKLSDGKEESAKVLAAIVQGSEDDIAALNEKLAQVEEGKEAFSSTVAAMETDFDEKMEAIVLDMEQAIKDLNMEDAAFAAGEYNMQGLIDGTYSKRGELAEAYAQMAREAIEAYKREVGQQSPSKKFKEAARYDAQGLIEEAEAQQEKVGASYAELAMSALEGYKSAAARGMADLKDIAATFTGLDSLLGAKADVGDLEYTLWTRTDGKYASDAEKYAKQLDLLGQKQEDQEAVVMAAAAAYEAVVAQYGLGTEESYKYQKALLQEKLAWLDLADEIENVTNAKERAAREEFIRQAELSWASSGLGMASAAAQSAGHITPYEVAQIANTKIVMPDSYQQANQAVLESMALHLPATLEEPQAPETLARQIEAMSAATVNAISGIAQGGVSGPITVRVVMPDGEVLAEAVADPLVAHMDANGTPILNPVR